ncbi:MAG TPA: IPT/TIG domain-containing protein [Bryobacteraceae bacterium]|nr:IPT/TIG domain-containing protein [Bryobacteraceae bacterium]
MTVERVVFTFLALASPCAAQTYTLSDCKDGASLTVKIDSLVSTTGPIQSNGGHSYNMIFFGDFTLTVNGSTHTYPSVLGSAGINYTPAVGNLTDFLIESDDPSVRAVGNLQAVGDLIPNALLPQTLPPISAWNNPTSDYIQYGNPVVTDYIDTVGECTSGTGSATPAINNVITASAFGAFNAIAPGTWIEIYGTNLAPDTRPWASSDFNGQTAPESLDGVQVTVNGQNAYLSYIASNPGQINAQVPYTIPVNQKVQVVVNNNGALSAPYDVASSGIQAGLLAPASFKIGANQYVAALASDGVTYILPTGAIPGVASRPAKPNETITMYGIGFGLVSPPTAAGEIAPASSRTLLPWQISFDQTPAEFTYDGLAPGLVGLYQFDVVVPSIPDNDLVPLKLTLSTEAGAQTVYIAVHQ